MTPLLTASFRLRLGVSRRNILQLPAAARRTYSDKSRSHKEKIEAIEKRIKSAEAQIQSADASANHRRMREMGSRDDAMAASLIAGPCLVVYLAWTWVRWYEQEQHDNKNGIKQKEGWFKLLGISTPPPLVSKEFMLLNFTETPLLVLKGEQSSHVHVTSAISHIGAPHLAGNMLGLFLCSINIPLPSRLGAFKFVSLFLGSAIAGSLTQLYVSCYCFNKTQDPSYLTCQCLGASGGISGLVTTAILWRPKSKLILPMTFLHGIPTWLYLAFTMGTDVLGLLAQLGSAQRGNGPQTGHGAHLGGSAIGALAFASWRKTLLKV